MTCGSWWRPADAVAVGFNVPIAELLSNRQIERHGEIRALGPDLLAGAGERYEYAVDTAEIVRRMRGRGRDAVADVLLNQRVVAGIGNVFKSEILFVAGIDPFAPVVSLSDADLERIIGIARDQLAASVLDRSKTLAEVDRAPNDAKPRSERRAVGLQPRGQAVPALRHGHPFEEDRAGCQDHVLVSAMPGWLLVARCQVPGRSCFGQLAASNQQLASPVHPRRFVAGAFDVLDV